MNNGKHNQTGLTYQTWTHQNGVSDVVEEKPKERLETVLSWTNENGVTVTVSTVCGSWEYMQKFLSDFESTLLKGKNGKAKCQSKTDP